MRVTGSTSNDDCVFGSHVVSVVGFVRIVQKLVHCPVQTGVEKNNGRVAHGRVPVLLENVWNSAAQYGLVTVLV